MKEKVTKAKKKAMDDVAAVEIETKKTTRAASRKVKDTAEKVANNVEDVAENAAAAEIETKKKVRAAGRKVKEKKEEAEVKIADTKEAIADKAAAAEIEVKKTAGKVKKTAKKTAEKAKDVKEEVKKPVKKVKAAKMNLVFESSMGGQITPEEIAAKVPKGSDAAYIKLEKNKIYWVKGEETGSVDIW